MSRRATILLAIGMVVLGLVIGFLAGGVTTGFLTRRSAVVARVGRFAPGYFGAQRMMPRMMPMMPYNAQPMMPGGMMFGRGGYGAMPFYGQSGRFGNMPRTGLRQAPFSTRQGLAQIARRFDNGIRITSVESNSPADKAGIKVGDVITTVAGTKIDRSNSFTKLLQTHKPGDKLDLTVTRSGQNMTVSVTLGASPQNSNTAYLGIRYGPALAPRPKSQ